MRKITVLVTFITIMLLLNYNIFQRENHLKHGKSIFLKLAPVDPRSLMQGDYMALDYEISSQINTHLSKNRVPNGLVLVSLNKQNIVSFVSVNKNKIAKENQLLIQYRIRGEKIKFATNAFFFQDGTGSQYQNAKYGKFKVNKKHELLLTSLHDGNLTNLSL